MEFFCSYSWIVVIGIIRSIILLLLLVLLSITYLLLMSIWESNLHSMCLHSLLLDHRLCNHNCLSCMLVIMVLELWCYWLPICVWHSFINYSLPLFWFLMVVFIHFLKCQYTTLGFMFVCIFSSLLLFVMACINCFIWILLSHIGFGCWLVVSIKCCFSVRLVQNCISSFGVIDQLFKSGIVLFSAFIVFLSCDGFDASFSRMIILSLFISSINHLTG